MEWSNSNAPHLEFCNSRAHVLNVDWSSSNALNADFSNSNAHVVNLELSTSSPSIYNWELSSSHHPLLTLWHMWLEYSIMYQYFLLPYNCIRESITMLSDST